MSKRKYRKATQTNTTESQQGAEVFSFGEPTPVLDRREILDYIECTGNGRWYEPPVSFDGLARSLRAAVHHSSPIYVKRNILASTFIPHPLLSQQEFSKFALDYLVFGNAYLELIRNQLGEPLRFEAVPAKYVRRGVEEGTYWFVQGWKEPHQFAAGSIFHLIEPDINQEIYGLPEYLSALNSAWLNEAATLFRRKYYQNGAHAGYILYMTDAAQSSSDIDSMRKAMRDSQLTIMTDVHIHRIIRRSSTFGPKWRRELTASADRPRVRVEAVSTRDTVRAPNMVSKNTRSTIRPTGPWALKPWPPSYLPKTAV